MLHLAVTTLLALQVASASPNAAAPPGTMPQAETSSAAPSDAPPDAPPATPPASR